MVFLQRAARRYLPARVAAGRQSRQQKYESFNRHHNAMRRAGKSLALAVRGIPSSQIVKLKYTSFNTINPAAGGTAFQQFRVNSAYDPDLTNAGHQPSGFDQYMALYGNYTVLGMKCSTTFATVASGAGDPVICGHYIDNDSTTPASGAYEQLLEQPSTRYKYIGTLAQAKNGNVVTSKWSAKKWFARSSKTLSTSTDFSGTDSTNPAVTPILNIFAFPSDATSDATAVDCWSTFSFIVKFSNRRTIPLS